MSDERVVPGVTNVANVQKHIARYNAALSLCSGKEVVDVACGVGYGTWLISTVAKQVAGFDIDEEAIHQARSRYSAMNSAFYRENLYDIDIKPVDVVVSFETIEHLDDEIKTQKKLMSFIKKDGFIIFSVPLNEQKGFNEHHVQRYTLETARKLFSGHKKIAEVVQRDINFYNIGDKPWTDLYTYYIGIVQKVA